MLYVEWVVVKIVNLRNIHWKQPSKFSHMCWEKSSAASHLQTLNSTELKFVKEATRCRTDLAATLINFRKVGRDKADLDERNVCDLYKKGKFSIIT